jgi:hypothetical protein
MVRVGRRRLAPLARAAGGSGSSSEWRAPVGERPTAGEGRPTMSGQVGDGNDGGGGWRQQVGRLSVMRVKSGRESGAGCCVRIVIWLTYDGQIRPS